MKIMIVDDAPFMLEIQRTILESAGYKVIAEAANGKDAVGLALRTRPDVILMDIVMPEKSGVDAAREILEKLPKTKIIAISTLDQESMVLKALDAGCKSYVVKPFEKAELLGAIDQLLDKNQPVETAYE